MEGELSKERKLELLKVWYENNKQELELLNKDIARLQESINMLKVKSSFMRRFEDMTIFNSDVRCIIEKRFIKGVKAEQEALETQLEPLQLEVKTIEDVQFYIRDHLQLNGMLEIEN